MDDFRRVDYSSVPFNEPNLEKEPGRHKYNVNKTPVSSSGMRISTGLCVLLVLIALLLATLVGLGVYFFVPHECSSGFSAAPAAFTKASTFMLLDGASRDEGKASTELRLQRLPLDFVPLQYRLKLMPFLFVGNFTTHGFVSIEVECTKATDKILLHAVDIDIKTSSVRVKFIKGDYFLRLNNLTYDKSQQMYTFHMDRKTQAGEMYHIHMDFVGRLNDLNQGFYRSGYIDNESKTQRWIASTQFSPIDARRAFPCFDEPALKASFEVSLARPNNMSSLSNMPRVKMETSMEMDGYIWDHFEITPRMSTYLLAFVVSDLQPYEFNQDGRVLKIWSRKDVISDAVFASRVVPKMLTYYERYFDVKFPLPKLDLVAVPDFGYNAMENWGLLIFRESTLLLNEAGAMMAQRRHSLSVIAHELVHQWFGNLVTPHFWGDLWLKEGFANFFAYRGVHHIEPTWHFADEVIVDEQFRAMKTDCLIFAHPLSHHIQRQADIRQAFDAIAYAKGAAIAHMLQNVFGEEVFRSAIKHYLNKNQYNNVNASDLVQGFVETNPNVPALGSSANYLPLFLKSWIEQAGFPVVTVIADYDNKTITLKQQRFLLGNHRPQEDDLWWIPVSYVTQSRPDFNETQPKMWLKGEEKTTVSLDIDNGYLLNLKHTGYYIVNYDEKNWNLIITNLMNFPLAIRTQLLSNAMDLARANLLDYDIPLKMLIIIGRRDNHLIPYRVAFDKVNYLYNMLIAKSVFSRWQDFVEMVFNTAFENTALAENPNDPYDVQLLRPLILEWACRNSESRCVTQARLLYRALIISNKKIPSNLRPVVYCTAIREGSEGDFDFAYELYLNSTESSDRETLLKSLGCARKPWLLSRYLNMMLDPASGIRKQDGKSVFTSVAQNPFGYQIAFSFLRGKWNDLKNYYGLAFNRLGGMLESVGTFMNKQSDLEQLVTFRQDIDLATATQAFDMVYESVKSNVDWMDKCYPSIKKWLLRPNEHFGY